MGGFAEQLLANELLSTGDLVRAEEIALRAGERLPATLVRLGLLPELEIAQLFQQATGFERFMAVPGQGFAENPDINRRYLRRRAIAPLGLDGERLDVAMADPEDQDAIDALAFAFGAGEVKPVIAAFSEIEELLGADEEGASETSDLLSGAGGADDLERLLEGNSDAPIIRLVQRILASAANRRASDVHIEPMARHLSIRYRIDGRLVEVERHPDALAGPIASRIKVMAGLDIAESRLPQDGRLRLTVRGRDIDVRVSTSPIANGESIVLRLLGRSEVSLDLERLGLPPTALEALIRALSRPHGIILLTGPTGSGKSTTLYAAISRLRRPEVKILTVEDPVEVLLEGVNQVQVRPDIGLSYANTLRAFLRQDPDILMIGEIRDRETAEIAMRAALTGHLVLSTLHTNSAIGAFTRLSDIGIQPYLTASTIVATIAQRLIRALCPQCSTERPPSAGETNIFKANGVEPPKMLHDAIGCDQCLMTGYRGRIPLIEVLEVDELLREHIREDAVETWQDPRSPEHTLLGHGLSLVGAGLTTLVEVERAVQMS